MLQIVQKMARRLATRCNEMFNKGVDACRKLSIEMNQYCKDQLIWPVENWFCPMISIEKFCQVKLAMSVCMRANVN